MAIKIVGLIGKNCITIEDGQKIYSIILPELKLGNVIDLDFSGVNIFASPFFNAAIGRLLKDFSKEVLEKLIKYQHLNQIGTDILKLVIDNSVQYYSNEDFQKKLDEILTSKED